MCGSSDGTMKACTPLPPSAAAMAALMLATLGSAGALGAAAAGAAAPAAPAAAAMPDCCMRLAGLTLLLGDAMRRACRHCVMHRREDQGVNTGPRAATVMGCLLGRGRRQPGAPTLGASAWRRVVVLASRAALLR